MSHETRRTLSEWLQFLLNAGIPASQAANYAVSFVENRIEKDMLSDLDKDYLKELGVTVLGDIIAILKHAKKVASQKTRKQEIQVVRTSEGIKKTTPASRLVDHYLKASGSDSNQGSPRTMEVVDDDDDDVVWETPPSKPAVAPRQSKLRSERLPAASSTRASSSVPRRRVAPPASKNDSREEVPVQKKRRVLPEHEGGYKIKMPDGTIPRTAKLIAQGKLSTKSPPSTTISTKGVFSRLGSSSATPSMTGAVDKVPRLQANISKASKGGSGDSKMSFTVTGLGKIDPQNIVNSMKMSTSPDQGVFRRLGGSVTTTRRTIKRPATSTQPDEPVALDAAPYMGVLKDGGKHSKPTNKMKFAPSAADKTGFAVSRLATDNVKTRLGGGQSKLTRTFNTSAAAAAAQSSVKVSLKRRLRGGDESTVSSSTDMSGSAIRVSTKPRAATVQSRQPSGQRAKQAVTIGASASAGVFSRLGNR